MHRLLPIARTFPLALALLLLLPPAATAAPRRGGPHLSAALERMLRDELAAGRTLPPQVIERWGLDQPETDPTFAPGCTDVTRTSPAAPTRALGLSLGTDELINDRSTDNVPGCCSGRPLGQAETTIAAWGSFLLAGWNDGLGFCNTSIAVQGYGYSVDGGGTWTDAGQPPSPITGGRFRGDPVHAVNRRNGDFYICGLYEDPLDGANSGIALLRGHFAGGSFVVDADNRIAVGGSNFLDKEWMAVDSLSGMVYVTYSNFISGLSSQIELIRSADRGVTWSAPQVLSAPASFGNVQGSRPLVGPAGELYVVWYDWGYPLSHMRVRRSDDLGLSFGPEHTICDFYENGYSGAPGYRRGFAPTLPGAAVDCSNGPHRGRLYVTWDEAVDFYDAPFPASPTVVPESEVNDFFASATPFTVGSTLRGGNSTGTDVDYFRFTGLRGQTLFFASDSATAGASFNMRLVCAADTSNQNDYRYLAYDLAQYNALAFTLPADGTYYLRMSLNSFSGTFPPRYRIRTTWDTPTPGERARDHRDQFIAWSDDGASWSTPARLTDADPWFDGIFPEVTVDGTGAVHVYWHDWRDDGACGALSNEYLVSSGDGGVTWGANRKLSDASSFWSINACGSANQGDYQGIASEGHTVYPCWTDSRLGDPDAWMESDRFDHQATCPGPQAASGGSDVVVAFSVINSGSVPGTFEWSLSDGAGWLASATPALAGSVALPAGAAQVVTATLKPGGDCYPAALDTVRIAARDIALPGRLEQCLTTVSCAPTTGVAGLPAALAFAPPRPNPSSGSAALAFALPRAAHVRLAVYGASGARVRTLADGDLPPGRHERTWDGRDDAGRRVAPGLYYVRLESGDEVLRRPVSLIR